MSSIHDVACYRVGHQHDDRNAAEGLNLRNFGMRLGSQVVCFSEGLELGKREGRGPEGSRQTFPAYLGWNEVCILSLTDKLQSLFQILSLILVNPSFFEISH